MNRRALTILSALALCLDDVATDSAAAADDVRESREMLAEIAAATSANVGEGANAIVYCQPNVPPLWPSQPWASLTPTTGIRLPSAWSWLCSRT